MKIKKIFQSIFKAIAIFIFKLIYGKVKENNELNSNLKYLKEEINLNMGEIGELTSEIWDGYGFDELEPHFGEETSEKIIDESWAYLCDLFPN